MASQQRPKNDYPKILNTPIDMRDMQSIIPAVENMRFNHQFDLRIDALFKYFGLNRKDKTDWQVLTLCLAKKHIRGFQIIDEGKKQGRPKERNFIADMNLIERVETKSRKKNNDISWACEQLAKTPDYKDYKKGTLETWYYGAKKRHPYSDKLIALKIDSQVEYSPLVALSFLIDPSEKGLATATKTKR